MKIALTFLVLLVAICVVQAWDGYKPKSGDGGGDGSSSSGSSGSSSSSGSGKSKSGSKSKGSKSGSKGSSSKSGSGSSSSSKKSKSGSSSKKSKSGSSSKKSKSGSSSKKKGTGTSSGSSSSSVPRPSPRPTPRPTPRPPPRPTNPPPSICRENEKGCLSCSNAPSKEYCYEYASFQRCSTKQKLCLLTNSYGKLTRKCGTLKDKKLAMKAGIFVGAALKQCPPPGSAPAPAPTKRPRKPKKPKCKPRCMKCGWKPTIDSCKGENNFEICSRGQTRCLIAYSNNEFTAGCATPEQVDAASYDGSLYDESSSSC